MVERGSTATSISIRLMIQNDEDHLRVVLIYSPKLNAMDPSVSIWFLPLFVTRGDCRDGGTSTTAFSYSFDKFQSLFHSPLPFWFISSYRAVVSIIRCEEKKRQVGR